MRISKYTKYTCCNYDVLEVNEDCCYIYAKKENCYIRKNISFHMLGISYLVKKRIKMQLYDVMMYAMILGLPFVIYRIVFVLLGKNWNLNLKNIFYSMVFLIINIFIHECSHYLSLLVYGCQAERPKLKIENGVLKIYTDTTASYLLPKYKRIVVYLCGILFNIYIIWFSLIVWMISPSITLFTIAFIMLNVIPSTSSNNDVVQLIKLFIAD